MYRKKILQGDHSPHVASPQVWNNPRSLRFMIRTLMSEANPNNCLKVVDDRPLILAPYEDDLFLTGANPLICKSKRELDFALGMVNCKPVTTSMKPNFKKLCGSVAGPNLGNASEFRQVIIALMFFVNSFVDIYFAVSMLSSYMDEPHWIGAKNLLRYLRGTISHGVRYTAENVKLHDYSNIVWAGSVEDRKRTSGCCFSLCSATISWMSRKQKSVALSTVETEYIATSMSSCKVAWLRKLFSELFGYVLDTTVIFFDNQSWIRLLRNPVFYDHSKHIDISYHFIWDMVHRGARRLHCIETMCRSPIFYRSP
eukprot:PITA_32032